MSKRRAALFAAIIYFILASASAMAVQPTPVPYVKPDLSGMSYFIGTWSCHEKLRGSDRPDTTTYSTTSDGRWISYHDIAPPFDKYRTKTIVSDARITYNPLTKQWVNLSFDDFGGYGISTSPGWSGSALVWTDTLSNDGTLGVSTITKVSTTELHYRYVSHNKSGKANPVDHGVCTKS